MNISDLLKKGADKAVDEAKKGVKRKAKGVAKGAARKQINKSSIGSKALKTYDKTKKVIKNSKRAIAFGKFIASSPVGWATGGAIAVGVLAIGSSVSTGVSNNASYQNMAVRLSNIQTGGNQLEALSNVSEDEVAVLLTMGCDVDIASSGSSSKTDFDVDGNLPLPSENPFVNKIGGRVQIAEKMKTRLIKEGFSGGQIAVILSIGARESELNPKIKNEIGHIGIFQWGDQSGDPSVGAISPNSNRTKWMRDKGMDVWDIESQMSLLMYELTITGGNGMPDYNRTIREFANHQTTSDSDIEALMEIWDHYYEGVKPGDAQRNVHLVRSYVKGVLELFPELNDVKQSANFLSNFGSKESDEGGRSNSVSPSTADVCQVATDNIGGDALAQAIAKASFGYYGKGIGYSLDTDGPKQRSVHVKRKDGYRSEIIGGGYLDCSTFVRNVMADIGLIDDEDRHWGSTETLFSMATGEDRMFQKISRSEATTGDIFILGKPGFSSGPDGHTGIFLNKNWIIHCSSGRNTNDGGSGDVFVEPYPYEGGPMEEHFYRIIDRSVPEKAADVPASETFVDVTTNEALESAVKSGKIENPKNVDAGQSAADMMGGIVAGEGDFTIGNVPTAYPVGQCTWGAKQVAPWVGEYWGNGGDWAAAAASAGFKIGKTPKVGAVVCWTDGGYGHVAVVTGVRTDGTIKVLESNVNHVEVIKDHRGWFNPIGIQGEVTYIYPN